MQEEGMEPDSRVDSPISPPLSILFFGGGSLGVLYGDWNRRWMARASRWPYHIPVHLIYHRPRKWPSRKSFHVIWIKPVIKAVGWRQDGMERDNSMAGSKSNYFPSSHSLPSFFSSFLSFFLLLKNISAGWLKSLSPMPPSLPRHSDLSHFPA